MELTIMELGLLAELISFEMQWTLHWSHFAKRLLAQGGPENMPDDLGTSIFPTTPVVQLGFVTRASVRLRNVQPEVNLDQSYEVLKRPKKNVDAVHAENGAFRRSKFDKHQSCLSTRDHHISCSLEYGQYSFRLPPSSPYDKFMKAAGC